MFWSDELRHLKHIICKHSITPKSIHCSDSQGFNAFIDKLEHPIETESLSLVMFLIFSILLLGLILCFKASRKLDRNISQNIQQEVDDEVKRYFALKNEEKEENEYK